MQKILFYDGDCGFCNKSVQFVLNNERNSDICFSALQSDFALNFFKEHNFPKADLSTFYFWDGKKLYQKSAGALRLVNDLKFKWQFLKIGYLIPVFLRDKIYDFIAKRRHKLSVGFCALPSPEQKKRFI
ncbi:MAG: thiol-disulfide oxidoreductase DCC family protein [Flavobacteriia bacterium]|jgi:predicted DCC family thiol-disulfide oxidoreductase YuxK